MNKLKQIFDITISNKDFHNTLIADAKITVNITHLKRFEIKYNDIAFFQSLKGGKPLLN